MPWQTHGLIIENKFFLIIKQLSKAPDIFVEISGAFLFPAVLPCITLRPVKTALFPYNAKHCLQNNINPRFMNLDEKNVFISGNVVN